MYGNIWRILQCIKYLFFTNNIEIVIYSVFWKVNTLFEPLYIILYSSTDRFYEESSLVPFWVILNNTLRYQIIVQTNNCTGGNTSRNIICTVYNKCTPVKLQQKITILQT